MNALPIVIIKSNKDFCSSAFLLWKFLSIRNKNPKDLRFKATLSSLYLNKVRVQITVLVIQPY